MKRATEQECQRTIVEAAKRGGWLVHAERPAMRQSGKWSTPVQGDVGFPDLCLAHWRRGVVFVELKRKPNKVTGEQRKWLDYLANRGYLVAEVWWMPEELDDRVAWLLNGDEVCQNCGKWLISDLDGGPGYSTLTHRTDAERERCVGLANQVNS